MQRRLLAHRHGWIVAFAALLLGSSSLAQTSLTLVPTNAAWRFFKGTTEPSPAAPNAWRNPDFADGAWAIGPAPFWYGEAAMFGGTGTELTDMAGAYGTLFLRTKFSVANPALLERVILRARCDDGFVAWLNGRRIAALNAPTGEPTAASLASANVAEPIVFAEYATNNVAGLLVAGENTLAVQVLNTGITSSDLVFDGDLRATLRDSGPPTILAVAPTPGLVRDLTQITVTFTEPVTGVRAEDFLINGRPAASVGGSGNAYTFTFPRPAYGTVGVTWSTFHTVTDLETPPLRFELASPGSTWAYELLDPDGPMMARRLPPPGSAVSALGQVEVTFDKAVTGLDAADLLRGGVAATNVTGLGAGPYVFEFPGNPPPGPVTIQWRADHGIASDSLEPHAFNGGSWSCTINPGVRPAALVITEFMAENLTSYRDEDQDPEDWIEIWNPTGAAVGLDGWSLSRDADEPGAWVFPAVSIPAGGHLVVFASGKDRRPTSGRLHTDFKLNPNGGYVGLFGPELPRRPVSEVRFGLQGSDYSAGRENNTGEWRYFKTGSPGTRNGTSTITEAVTEVRFSVERGFLPRPFRLGLTCDTPNAVIRYTLNGSPPTEATGFLYTNLIQIQTNQVVRAAAFRPNSLPSRVVTHTYLINLTSTRLRLPALSLVTATNNLYGRTGIMEVNPRNTTQRGAAWERPVSVEWIRTEDNGGFQVDCGLRLQGGDYVRGQYNYRTTQLPFSKYSFRLYFRGEYGQGRLNYPLFPETTQDSFDTVVLRAGMNDHSNPFLADEFVRTLARDCGQPASVGNFVHLFINGVYKGYYNPCERIDVDFLRAYHGGGEKWDVMAQSGEVREGDATAFTALRTLANTKDLADPTNYRDVAGRLDLTNFVDYLCPLIYADADDWPHNNWRAARERVAGGLYRFYVWDAEWTFGLSNGHSTTFNTIANQLSTLSPPWGGTDIQRIFNGLKKSPEFRLLFADRVHRHFFNGGALTDERLRARYADVTNRLRGVVSSFNNTIASTWIPRRRTSVLQHFQSAGFLASSNAPAFAQHGGRVESGYRLVITNLAGTIYYTTNGVDPRLPLTGAVAPDAVRYQSPITLGQSTLLRARSLSTTNWSALTEATFQVDERTLPIRFSEIMYHPAGGEEFEFVELVNQGASPVDVSGFRFDGIEFRFPEPFAPLAPGARLVVASSGAPTAFRARYPGVAVAGWFDGSLSNSGERLALLDRDGTLVTSVEFSDSAPWPVEADGSGPSLEWIQPAGSPSDPASWVASTSKIGTPGLAAAAPIPAPIRINEVYADDEPTRDWVELANPGNATVNLAGWSLSDSSDIRRYTFPAGTSLAPGALVRIWCRSPDSAPAPGGGLDTGFGLQRTGETLALYDAVGRRVDAVTFGSQVARYSLGRFAAAGSDAWQLAEPTPGSPNEPARLAPGSALVINEWLANPLPGGDDWIELHNTDPVLPAALDGLHLGTSNALFRLRYPAFVPPSGFVALAADDSGAPGHVEFRLPSTPGAIVLYDAAGAELNRVTYGRQSEGIGWGRLPDGSSSIVAMPGTATPGAPNYLKATTGVRLNEVLARNVAAVADPEGRFSDFIELHNPTSASVKLGGYSLGVGAPRPGEWTFPPAATLDPGAYLVIWAHPDRPAATNSTAALHLGRGLPAEGGHLWLFDAQGRLLDDLVYGNQLPDRSAGRSGEAWTLLAQATPGRPNAAAAALGDTQLARLNEWSAGSTESDAPDWFEVYNPNARPIDLGGHYLSDDPTISGSTNHVVAPLTFVAAGGVARWIADGRPEDGPEHLEFRLDPRGEPLLLLSPAASLIDAVDLYLMEPGISEGRWPDGSERIVRFPDSASPGHSNWLPHDGVVVNEILAHTDPPLEDAIELFNASATAADVSGWYLSNDADDLYRVRLPATPPLAAGSYHVLYEGLFGPAASAQGFTLNSAHGDDLWLTEVDAAGFPTGYRVHARIGASANAESWGLHPTRQGPRFVPLSRTTFGKDLPTSIAEFRSGTGLPNAAPRVGPAALTEIHYRPLVVTDTDTVEEPAFEFVEIANVTGAPLRLFDPLAPANTWRLRGGIEFEFPSNAVLAAGQRVLVVSFAPTNIVALDRFRGAFGVAPAIPVFGPFRGRLANEGDVVRLERPDAPQAPPHPDAGYVPWLLVEEIRYGSAAPWPVEPAVAGRSLQRWRLLDFGDDPRNWIAGSASPGAATPAPATDRDFDGMDSDWETANGLNPLDPADAAFDPDQDGHSNYEEFLCGTDPRNAASVLRLDVAPTAPDRAPVLRFQSVAGRTYSLQSREHPAFGRWQRVLDVDARASSPGVVSWPVDTSATVPRFFRVVTPAAP